VGIVSVYVCVLGVRVHVSMCVYVFVHVYVCMFTHGCGDDTHTTRHLVMHSFRRDVVCRIVHMCAQMLMGRFRKSISNLTEPRFPGDHGPR
jgi:hypothetical protein